jgi:hypothetical protein
MDLKNKFDILPFLDSIPLVASFDSRVAVGNNPLSVSAKFRYSLCEEKLREILCFQRIKRVNNLKDEMNKHGNNQSSSARSMLLQDRTPDDSIQKQQQHLIIDTSFEDTKSSYQREPQPTSIGSYLNQSTERIIPPFSPATSLPVSSITQSNTSMRIISTSDYDLRQSQRNLESETLFDEELKKEDLSYFQNLLKQMEYFSSDLYESAEDVAGGGREEQEEVEDSSDDTTNDEEMNKKTKTKKSRPEITSPRIRYSKRRDSNKRMIGLLPPVASKNNSLNNSGQKSLFLHAPYSSNLEEEKQDLSNVRTPVLSNHFNAESFRSAPSQKSSLLLPLITEEIIWDLKLPPNYFIMDSKIFFFHNILWRLTFGLNNVSENDYYFFISPAEKLKSFTSLKIDFFLYPAEESPVDLSNENEKYMKDTRNSGNDEKKKKSSGEENQRKRRKPFARYAHENFTFPIEFNVSRGYEKFIQKEELKNYLGKPSCSSCSSSSVNDNTNQAKNSQRNHFSLKLSVVISTNLGPNGELIGCLNL